jgi:3-oxoacyl-[acyl-carrier protein] reductase
MNFENKTILITGASQGIGRAIAIKFAEEGALHLLLLSRNIEKLAKLRDEIENSCSTKVTIFEVDLSNLETITNIAKECKASKIGVDVIVNNAGIMKDSVIRMVTSQLINETYNVNVFGLIYVTQAFMYSMLKNRSGSIINISSVIGVKGNIGQSIYSSSKSAIIGFTKSLSKELASLNIRVNALAPGFIDTDMTKDMNEAILEKTLNSVGMKRIGKPEDVANAVLFLASDQSTYITGQIIGVDGGLVI